MCEGEFVTYLKYVKALKFTDKPDYDHLVRLFRDLYVNKGFKYDGVYDWSKVEKWRENGGNGVRMMKRRKRVWRKQKGKQKK